MVPKLRIGTRASKLAMHQTTQVVEALKQALVAEGPQTLDPADLIEVMPIRTSGDKIQNCALRDVGGKALFTKELDSALCDGRIDLAVHSAKDLEAELMPGVVLSGCLRRGDARDVMIVRSEVAASATAPFRFGTSSLRRHCHVTQTYPHAHVHLLRGNVERRLKAVTQGETDATMLAKVGLDRLGIAPARYPELSFKPLALDQCLPASSQGVIAITARQEDAQLFDLVQHVTHVATYELMLIERRFLKTLGGDCFTPVGLYIEKLSEGSFRIHAVVGAPEERRCYRQTRDFTAEDDAPLHALAQEMRQWLMDHAIL